MEPRNLQISQQEHEALALAGLGDKAKKEQPFDPQRGLRQSQDDLRTIRKIHAEVASATTASLSARLKTRVNFELDAEIAAITFSALKEAMAASGTSCINVLDVAPFGKGLLTLDLPTCFRFIDRCLGGSGRAAVPERTFFTDVEMITLDEVVNLILSGFQRSWSKVLPEFANKLLQREMDPYVLNLQWTPTERILSSTFNIVSDIVTGEMKICLPYSPVASHLPKPGSAVFSQTSGNTSVPMLEKRLQKVPLDVRAILGRTEIPVRDLLRLKVGDLVRLDNSVGEPIYLQVEGQTKFSARLGLVGKKCGLKIESQIREIEE